MVKWGFQKWTALWAAEKAATAVCDTVATTITACDVAARDGDVTDLVEQLQAVRRELEKCREEGKRRQEEHEKRCGIYKNLTSTLRAERDEADYKCDKALKKQVNLEKGAKDLQREIKRIEHESAEVKERAKRLVDKDPLIQEYERYVRDMESDANQKIDAANQRVDAVLRENEHLKLYLSNWLLVRR